MCTIYVYVLIYDSLIHLPISDCHMWENIWNSVE